MGLKRSSSHFPTDKGGGGPSKKLGLDPVKIGKKAKEPIFNKKGHVTFNSISARREFFLGKSVARLEHELNKYGYETQRRPSSHVGSKSRFIITINPSKDRNIFQIQVSKGSARHGNIQYVKISTSDYGKIKIIAGDSRSYKTDGKERSKLLFRRKK